ncbi:hypothetical protein GOODEAATRI_004831 [Goodea atripinnis]|uniref:Uncharacterized protein n=1 Tax=Goodea atripinnis TaxID=208336 RepID=A0ABV0MF56_9TELE
MEVRLQAQEDEITLLKSSLADALRRIRIHDQLLPLLKQQLIAVNPSAARVLNQVCYADGFSSVRKLSVSSPNDGIHHAANAARQQSESNVSNANGHIGGVNSSEHQSHQRLPSLDKSTQTEPTMFSLSEGVQSLQLEDAFPPGQLALDGTRGKLHHIPSMEEEEDDRVDEEARQDQKKEMSWAPSVEEHNQPTTVRCLQKEEFQDGSCSPDEPRSASASPGSDQNLSSRSGPLSPIQEGDRTLCVSLPHRCFVPNQINLFL